MNSTQQLFFFLARLALSLLFLFSGVMTLLHFGELRTGLELKLCEWHLTLAKVPVVAPFLEGLIAVTPLLMIGGLILEGVGAILILIGSHTRLGASLLLVLLIAVSLLYHSFWTYTGSELETQLRSFLIHLALMGGLVLLIQIDCLKAGMKHR